MNNLINQLVENRKIAELTASKYIRMMFTLHDKTPFKNLNFLKKTDEIDAKLAKYTESTKASFYRTIVSITSMFTTPMFKKLNKHYTEKMMNKNKIVLEENATGKKNEKQEKNWITWNEVIATKDDLVNRVRSFQTKKNITQDEYQTLLELVVLSLYTDIPPRRNQDFLSLYVVKKWSDTMPKDRNYLDMTMRQFVFNKYKTATTYGTQIVACPDSFLETLSLFKKFYPLSTTNEYKLLVRYDGEPIEAVNGITRILNSAFGRQIGSTALRHIYLSNKYGGVKNNMIEDAEAMGHSVSTQQGVYVKH